MCLKIYNYAENDKNDDKKIEWIKGKLSILIYLEFNIKMCIKMCYFLLRIRKVIGLLIESLDPVCVIISLQTNPRVYIQLYQ